jgi:hypothetical protein
LLREPAKEAEFDNFGAARIELLQALKGLVKIANASVASVCDNSLQVIIMVTR